MALTPDEILKLLMQGINDSAVAQKEIEAKLKILPQPVSDLAKTTVVVEVTVPPLCRLVRDVEQAAK